MFFSWIIYEYEPADKQKKDPKKNLKVFQRQKGVEPSSSAWKAEIMSRYMTAARSASDWNRTNDRQIFSLLLYQLSYTGLLSCDGVKYIPSQKKCQQVKIKKLNFFLFFFCKPLCHFQELFPLVHFGVVKNALEKLVENNAKLLSRCQADFNQVVSVYGEVFE